MEILSAHLCQTKYSEHSINKKMRKRSIIVRHGEVHAVDQDKDAHQQVGSGEEEKVKVRVFHKRHFEKK